MRAKRPIYADTYDRRRKIIIVIVVLAVLAAAVGGVWWWLHRNPRPSVAKYPELGVRMSQADGVLDSSELEAGGVSFVYLKATQGASFVDDNFATNQSRAGSLKVGAYHYFSFDSTPQAQAENFIKHVADAGELPIGIYVTYYGNYASDPPKSSVVARNLTSLISLLQAHYQQGVVLMGSASTLATIKSVAPSAARYVISSKKPATGSYWEYANAKLPNGGTDQTFDCVVYTKGTSLP
ncbi:GH25 family lysozyme [Lacticaseibacillus porcinae]|uniref:GH25 family lysozyme n=1 Tax=Lacticaseibacillus porcinae TaxID=1123687 RepID=UPI000F78BDEB|nr:GH25 family lysozyme [Lacticaseibacillus porcinae]